MILKPRNISYSVGSHAPPVYGWYVCIRVRHCHGNVGAVGNSEEREINRTKRKCGSLKLCEVQKEVLCKTPSGGKV